MAGLYIHIPYCRRKCLYCDFFSGGARHASWTRLVDAILMEFKSRLNELSEPLETFYVGGGTPSIMPVEEMFRLINGIKLLSAAYWNPEELTIELNPDDVSPDYIHELIKIGFNRMSLGVQVLDDHLLSFIGRRHNSECAINAIHTILNQKVNLSVDVMFGLPGLTMECWEKTLKKILSFRPPHISAYALMFEPGTALTVLRDSGRVKEASEEDYTEQYRFLTEILHQNGYIHYETSNYALPGKQSRHNSSYWLGKPYIGLGPAAHSYDGKSLRRANSTDLNSYLKGEVKYSEEFLTYEMKRDEYLLTRLRLSSGINLQEFSSLFGQTSLNKLIQTARKLHGVSITNTHVSINPENILIADDIISTLAASI